MTSHPANAQKTKQKKQVLIVDSNHVMGRILGKIIEKAGLGYAVAVTGPEGVEFCKTKQYDMALIEAGMGKAQGVDAIKHIRALSDHYNQIPIVAVSAKLSKEDIKRYLAAGANGTLAKPVNELNLWKELHKNLGVCLSAATRKPQEDDEIYAILDRDEMELLNWDTLKEYSIMLKGEYKRLMHDYLTVSPDHLGEIGEAVIDGNAEKVEYLAHKLKSTSIIFGADDVSNLAAQLEILGKENDLTHAGQFFKELHMSFERVQPVLRKKLAMMKMAI